MKVSIAICTWNRSRLLRQTLQQLKQLNIPADVTWEIVVVDNGSSDDTRAIIESFQGQLPVQYVFVPQPGHARSRNAAIANVTGELILWTDNDVIVEPNWLAAYVAGARKFPQAAFFGGKIVPVFESRKPIWLAETWPKCHPVYAARDLGNDEFELPPQQYPFGANFAVRTAVQKQFPFNVDWGRSASAMLGDDEINVLDRMARAGHVGIWLPTATLKHFIPDDRATVRYVSRYFVGQGQANVLKEAPTMQSKFHALRVAIHNRSCFALKRRFSPADEWVSHLIRASIAWGEFRAWNPSTGVDPTAGTSK